MRETGTVVAEPDALCAQGPAIRPSRAAPRP